MADARPLRNQVGDLPSKDALIKVFGHAKGFDLVAPDDELFIPELGECPINTAVAITGWSLRFQRRRSGISTQRIT